MSGHDAELDQLRQGVSCAALLERATPPWLLDRKSSTRRALKYRRQQGEVIIVDHDGRGWWNPLGSAKGDVFDLVQFLDPHLNFGQVRKVLRPFVGLSPTYPEALPKHKAEQCPHRMACARCDFYIPKPSGKAQMLEAKVDVDRRLALIPLTDGERAAIEQDRQALDRLLEGLADTRTPAGPTPRELKAESSSVHPQTRPGDILFDCWSREAENADPA